MRRYVSVCSSSCFASTLCLSFNPSSAILPKASTLSDPRISNVGTSSPNASRHQLRTSMPGRESLPVATRERVRLDSSTGSGQSYTDKPRFPG
ncbi:hypothetical protein BDR22DRAFT_858244 [Usnea florida]